LRGIDESDAEALVAQAAGRPLPPAVAAAVHARSNGNPFFSGELVRLLAEENLLDDADAVADAPVPAGVGDVLRRRLEHLPADSVEVLGVAAVLGATSSSASSPRPPAARSRSASTLSSRR
jgi:predicted ATPase